MQTKLLSLADVEHFIRSVESLDEESMLLCTVMEPLQLAESVAKGKVQLIWPRFLNGLRQAVQQKQFYIAPLDIDCLNRAMFDRSETYNVTGLWADICSATMSPLRTVHRLILRPSEETWWEDELYAEMESWHEEEDNHD